MILKLGIQKFVKLIAVLVLLSLFSGCALLSKQSSVNVYKRDDVDTSKSKVVVFPLLLKSGNKFEDANKKAKNTSLDALLGTGWTDEIGTSDVVVVPKIVISEIPNGWKTLGKFVVVLDEASAIEQTVNIPGLKKFVEDLSSKVGDGALGFAVVFEDEKTFRRTRVLHGNMGLFDTKKMTWKWITKYRNAYHIPIPYQMAVKELFSESWKTLKAKNKGKIK